MNKIVLVLDLDDTLYKEIEFLKSAYLEISELISSKINEESSVIYKEMLNFYQNGLNAFEKILVQKNITSITSTDLIQIYRNHQPSISLSTNTKDVLMFLKENVNKVGLITDGRGIQQRSKLKALGLVIFFDDIIISEEFGSEKPNLKNFKYFSDKYGDTYKYVYIGDNTKKDFVAPNKLGWGSICLKDNGENIHKQDFELSENQRPEHIISNFNDIVELVGKYRNNC